MRFGIRLVVGLGTTITIGGILSVSLVMQGAYKADPLLSNLVVAAVTGLAVFCAEMAISEHYRARPTN